MLLASLISLAVLAAPPSPETARPVVSGPQADPRLSLLEAMAQELLRNAHGLKLEDHGPPYFLSYQMKDTEQRVVAARFGAVAEDNDLRDRRIAADVRVGSYAFDSSVDQEDYTLALSGLGYSGSRLAPLDDDPDAVRSAFWLLTDEKYKAAVFQYLKKKGETVYAVADPNKATSFSQEKPSLFVQPPAPFPFSRDRWRKLSRAVSAELDHAPGIFDHDVRVTADKVVRYFVSSEGSRLVTEDVIYGVHVFAVARAPDGQLLDDSRDYYAPTEAQLPSDEQLLSDGNAVVAELHALQAAPVIDPYTGPALLEPDAAGVLFHEAVGHRLEGERLANDTEGKTFKDQVGKRVLPAFIDIADDPNLAQAAGKPLNGFYRYDDQGVRAQRAELIQGGVLQGYLLSRRPVTGFAHSNGHGRAQNNLRPQARMANLLVTSHRQLSDAELKRRLLAEARRQGKPYALIIRDITGGNTNTSTSGYQAFKGIPRMVYRVDVNTGKETLVRGVEIVGTPLSAMNKILATGKTVGVFNGFCGAESGSVPVSTVAPSTLLEEIELQRVEEGKDRPPLLGNPAWTK